MLVATGDSMTGAGIVEGDEVLVDRSLQPKNGDTIVADVDPSSTTAARASPPRHPDAGGKSPVKKKGPWGTRVNKETEKQLGRVKPAF
jgi:phage repressor protein C with HTH and peptisase S24 domain